MTGTRGVERFIYYRVAGSNTLRERVLLMQQQLCARHPRLDARLLRRADDAARLRRADGDARETWMETYAHPGGVDDALLAEIEALATQTLGAALDGARHVESFEPCAW